MPWPNQVWPNEAWPNESLDTTTHVRRNVPTLGEIISEIRRYLQDTNGAIWSDAEIRRNVNRAILKVWLDTEWEKTVVSRTFSENQSWGTVPDSILVLSARASSWNDEKMFPTDLVRLDQHDRDWERTSASNIPSRVALFSYDKFLVWPPVNANSGNREILLNVVPIPAEEEADGSTLLGAISTTPPQFISDLITLKATALCWYRQSWQKSQQFNRLYQRGVAEAQIKLRNTSDAHTYKMRPSGKFSKAHGTVKFKLR